jgi:trans-aconitate methyltransferase
LNPGETRVSPAWLALREPADAAARAVDLVDAVLRGSPPERTWVIHDLGGGSGAMGRWLAPRLPGPQRWVIHDRDADLLGFAAAERPSAPDGAAVSVETRRSDITGLDPADLAGATLITASALLDMLTEDELERIVSACAGASCPVLFALSVVGRVELTPAEPLDRRMAAAFDSHQRRMTERGRLLGPDAATLAAEAFHRRGAEVVLAPSPWRLDAAHVDLTTTWFTGWVAAACEQQPDLTAEAEAYTRRRLAQASAGELMVVVDHADLLALPERDQSS